MNDFEKALLTLAEQTGLEFIQAFTQVLAAKLVAQATPGTPQK